MKVLEIVKRAEHWIEQLPLRTVKETTERSYKKAFARMWREPTIDPLSPGAARDTYNCNRAALHWVSRLVLDRLTANCRAACERDDLAAVRHWVAILEHTLGRIEPALRRDPPLAEGALALESPASRWGAQAGPHPRRGANSKRHVLGDLPRDWDEQVWQAAVDLWNKPSDERHRDALAVELSAPVRPVELGREDVVVQLKSPHCLQISITPSKDHDGRYGTEMTTIKIDPVKAGGPAAHLALRCGALGGRMMPSVPENAHRKRLEDLGKDALPGCEVTITPYVCRTQLIADLKATFGAGAEVAAAAGQSTDRTQSRYGYAAHGRKRRGFVSIVCERPPRTGNVARARALAAKRKAATRKPTTGGPDS